MDVRVVVNDQNAAGCFHGKAAVSFRATGASGILTDKTEDRYHGVFVASTAI